MTDTHPIWSHRLDRDEVPEDGLHVDLVADEAVRAELAKAAGLREIARLAASFDVTRSGREALHVTGEVTSNVGQNCVVTLEPIEQNLVEPIDLTFVPDSAATALDAEASLSGDETEPPEALQGGAVDLGAIATEYFLLGIDPYPRKPGAVFESPEAPESGSDHPFAGLAAWKKSDPGAG